MPKFTSKALTSRLTFANVIALLALFVALGGTSYAAVTLANNSVKSKHIGAGQVNRSDIKKNAINSAKVANGSLVAGDFKAGEAPQGPQGPQGPKGDTGATGATGATGPAGPGARWVLVRGSDGSVLSTNDASITVTRDAGGGYYFVNFGSSVANKLLHATLNRTAGSQLGQVSVGPCGGLGAAPGSNNCAQSNNTNTAIVQTSDSAGATTDRNFFLSLIP
jgi:hypothetical protein